MSRQLGQPTPCLLHVAIAAPAEPAQPDAMPAPVGDYDEPYVFGQLRPTIDRPGPFTLREYVRLRLLRSRIQEARGLEPSPCPLPEGEGAAAAQVQRLARR